MNAQMPFEIDVDTLDQMSRSGVPHKILDVREPWEVQVCAFDDSIHIPMRQLPTSLETLPDDENLVVICHHGVRSLQVMAWLRSNGFNQVSSLRGGINAWAREVAPEMATY